MSGFYLMYRGWQDNPVFGGPKREPFCRRSAWVWLIEHAVFATTTVLIGGRPVELRRGQLSYSLRDLASQWGWAEARVRRWCVSLASAKMIECVTDAGRTIITICNYEKYQDRPSAGDAEDAASMTHRRRTVDAHNKEGKEGKEVEDSEEADASSAPAPLDAAAVLIGRCTTWLAKSTGRSEKSVRALVVVMLKHYGDGAVLEVFTEASRAPPAEPISWIESRLKRRSEGNGRNGRAAEAHASALDTLARAAIEHDDGEDYSGFTQTPH